MASFLRRTLRASAVVIVFLAASLSLSAQTRMSDKDVERTLNNLVQDTKKFRSSFNAAVGKSTIRKTTQEKDAKALVTQFQKQTQGMLNQFKSSKKVDASLPLVLDNASKIEKFKATVPLGPTVDSQWSIVRTELDTISQAFNAPAVGQ